MEYLLMGWGGVLQKKYFKILGASKESFLLDFLIYSTNKKVKCWATYQVRLPHVSNTLSVESQFV